MFNVTSVTRRKSPNVYKSCPKMISLEKWKILTPLQNLHRNVVDLGILIAAKVLKKLPKVQNIAKSGHTDYATMHIFTFANGKILKKQSRYLVTLQFLVLHFIPVPGDEQLDRPMYVLHIFFEFNINTTAFCLGHSSLHLLQ